MGRKLLGVFIALVALIGMTVVPGLGRAANASTGLAAQTTRSLASGVVYTTVLDGASRTVIHVMRIAPGAPVVIKAVVAAPSGRGTAPATTICRRAKALACVNGDYFTRGGVPMGGVMVNGHWLRLPTATQQQVWVDGASQFSIGAMPAGAVQSLGATNYPILRPGQPISIPEHDAFADRAHARTLVGWNGAGERLLVTVEQGRGSRGMNLAQAADLMRRLGATSAINEDGGGSSQMVVGGVVQRSSAPWPNAVANMWAVVAA